jgi:hypothetical protein
MTKTEQEELKQLRRDYPGAVIVPIGDSLFIKLSDDNDRTLLKVVYRKQKTDAILDNLTLKELRFRDDPQIQKIHWNIVIIFRAGGRTYGYPFEDIPYEI